MWGSTHVFQHGGRPWCTFVVPGRGLSCDVQSSQPLPPSTAAFPPVSNQNSFYYYLSPLFFRLAEQFIPSLHALRLFPYHFPQSSFSFSRLNPSSFSSMQFVGHI